MPALASIYESEGSLYVTTSHRTVAGFWIIDDRAVRLERPSADELRSAIDLALCRSQNDVPTPARDESRGTALLRAAGVRSWQRFMPTTKLVTVEHDGPGLTVEPWFNAGARAGFVPQPDLAVTLPDTAKATVLGQAVLDRLQLLA